MVCSLSDRMKSDSNRIVVATTEDQTRETFGVFEKYLITLGNVSFDDQIKIYPAINKFVV